MKTSKILFSCSIVLALFAVWEIPKAREEHREEKYCGKVLYKVQEEVHHKYNTSYQPTLVVDFGNDCIRDVYVTNYTYLTAYKGSPVCFTMDVGMVETGYHRVMHTGLLMVSGFISLVLVVVGLIAMVHKL